MIKRAVCPGSFDPVTRGHLDIIRRTAAVFGEVIVLVMANPEKNNAFSAQERAEMARIITADLPNVRIDIFQGLLADYVRERDIHVIVKGLRCSTDFEYEFPMAVSNRVLTPACDTMFFTSAAEYSHMSSTLVRQIAKLGGDFSSFVPPQIYETVKSRLSE